MDSTTIAHIVGGLSAIFVVFGVTGITSQDLTGFLNVTAAIISLVSFLWAHFAHKTAVTA